MSRWKVNKLEEALGVVFEKTVSQITVNYFDNQINKIDMAKKPIGLILDEIKQVIVKTQCFEAGAIELIDDFKKNHIDPVTNKLNVKSFEEGVEVVQTLIDNIRETSIECTGVDPKPEFGDGTPARILKLALGIIGLDLTKVIVPN